MEGPRKGELIAIFESPDPNGSRQRNSYIGNGNPVIVTMLQASRPARLVRPRAFIVLEDREGPPGVESPDLVFEENERWHPEWKGTIFQEIEVETPGE